ncbi:MAG: class I SAM-dependent rRNA methyltransferase [Bryobacteraceae bacterium]
MTTVRVNRKAADRALSGHPWLFSSDVIDRGNAQPGEAVRVVIDRRGSEGQLLGTAHFSSTSQITLRMLSNRSEPIDRAFFLARLQHAIAHRDRVVEDSEACRLVFSEADLLPGLIIDRYGPHLVLQTLTQGMDRAKDVIVDCLNELLSPQGILARNDATVRKLEDLPREVSTLSGTIPDRAEIRMNGLTLHADLLRGQKTGVYLDQRENYQAAARWARHIYRTSAHGTDGKPTRILDCFSSTGGFALHVAPFAETVETIESSESAIAAAEENARANNIANIQFRQADVFDFLSGASPNPGSTKGSGRYSMIILDPPAFAKSRRAVEGAARGYKDINFRALRLLEPGGVLVTCSCSHHMSEADLLAAVAEAALDAGKTLRVLERRTQASDHPILLTVPETLYLKCLILQVI